MSQNSLIEKIKDDAAKAVEEIKTAGSAEVEKIQREIEAEVVELQKSHRANLEKTKKQMELVALSKAKQSGSIAVQSAKRAQIDSIFSSVIDDLQNQDAAAYVAFFSGYVKEIVPAGVEVKSVSAPKARLAETEEIIKTAGLAGTVNAESAIKAGLVIYTSDGVYDVTLARLMNERRNELEMIIVNAVKN